MLKNSNTEHQRLVSFMRTFQRNKYYSFSLWFTIMPILFLLVILSVQSCKHKQEKAFRVISTSEIKTVNIRKIIIHRFDDALFKADINNMKEELVKLKPTFPFFLDADLENQQNIQQMQMYLRDNTIQAIQKETMKVYPELTFLEEQLTDAFGRLKVIMPEFEVPRVFTYISGGDFEMPVKYVDNQLIIALDMYLGSDYKMYSLWGIPKYICYRMRKEQILPDCMMQIAKAYTDKYEIKTKSLLDRMVYEGKLLYLADMCLPETPDSIKIAYTTSQEGWAEEFQGNVWSFFIEHDLLHTTDIRKINKFMTDGPFTSTFSKNSPPRIGYFIGWQIVRQYMKKNEQVTVLQLLEEINSTQILQLSGYKPKKK